MAKPSSEGRRLWMAQLGALTAAQAASPLALSLAAASSVAAQTHSNYKALVCVFLQGGNDAYNTVLRTDSSSWARYLSARPAGPESLTLPQATLPGGVLPLHGFDLALHPQLKHLQDQFDRKRLAIVSNIGPLLQPLSKQDYSTSPGALPPKLFSHNDQQSTWQSMHPEGASVGWGGRMADMLASGNTTSLFTAISAAGRAVWLSGQSVRQYQVAPNGAIKMGVTTGNDGVDRVFNIPEVAAALKRIATDQQAVNTLEKDLALVAQRSMSAEQLLSKALPPASAIEFAGLPSNNSLAKQLQIVARCIGAQKSLGVKRQVFFVNHWGYDTHDNQKSHHALALKTLNDALSYFDQVLIAQGQSDQVTTFTSSDFGRTFTSNGDGSDHGWGGHHFVMGGAVNGGQVIGNLPVYGVRRSGSNQFDDTPDQIHNGIMLPTLAVEHLGSALARWFGLSPSQIGDVFPRLSRFDASVSMNGLLRT